MDYDFKYKISKCKFPDNWVRLHKNVWIILVAIEDEKMPLDVGDNGNNVENEDKTDDCYEYIDKKEKELECEFGRWED